MPSRLSDNAISTTRLISFSDGVFAIAVTLLVFNLKVPHIPAADVHRQLPGMIREMMPHFTTYVLTFLLVAVYWTFHHRMLNMVTHLDNPFLWMNIWYLLVISFIPFPSALFGSYPNETLSFIFYVCSMVLVTSISMLMLAYASYNNRLINKDIPKSIIKYLFLRQFTSLLVFFLAIPLALYNLHWALYSLFIIFPLHWVTKKYFKKFSESS